MVPMMVTTPLHLVRLNFTSFETTTNLNESPKIENVLVIVNHFTRYTRAYVTKDQKASTATSTSIDNCGNETLTFICENRAWT